MGGSTQKHMTVRYRQTCASSVFKVIPITTTNLGTKQRYIFIFTPRPFYPRENSPRNSLSMRLGTTVWFQRGNSVIAMQSLCSLSLLRERNLRVGCSVADTYERCEGSSAPKCKPFFYPEDGGNSFHWNFGTPNYRASHGRGQQYSSVCHADVLGSYLQFGYKMWSTGLQNSHPTRLVEYDAL